LRGRHDRDHVFVDRWLLSHTHRRYLRTLLPIREAALAQAVTDSPVLSKPPLLCGGDNGYATGATLRELIAEGVLERRFGDLAGSFCHLAARSTDIRSRRSVRPVPAAVWWWPLEPAPPTAGCVFLAVVVAGGDDQRGS
jgi:hypothetical protein